MDRSEIERLIADGWAVVPILRGRKNPTTPDWQRKTFTPDDFDTETNVGVKCGAPSGWRIDVDLDAPEAVRAGNLLLPQTDCIHGRASKPASHHWFVCTGAKSVAFKDLDGTVLLEMRGTGHQTVIPPSIHSSGEPIVWVRNGAPLPIEEANLLHAVRATAIAALLARHWPTGSRHVAAGHVAGFLVRVGFEAPWVEQIVRTAATLAGDEEVEDRARIARDTCAKAARGEAVTGGPKLAEVFGRGQDLASRIYQWMGRAGHELVDQLNEIHFVAQLGNDMVVGTESPGETVSVQDFEGFRRRYYNRYAPGGKTRLGEWWLSHPDRRTYRRMVFAPPPLVAAPGDYNTWRGFAIEPDPLPNPATRCQRWLEHLFRVICNEEQAYFEYLLDWCALTVQKPGVPIGVAVVLRGDSGAGKGSFADSFGRLFGPHYMQVDKQEHITGRFAAHLSSKVLLFADEAVWAGNRQDAGALKRLVTERTLTIERKFMDAVSEPNCLHLIMATNERWVWPATLHERRGFILNVTRHSFADRAYFQALHQEWRTGGAAAFLAFCLQRPVADQLGPLPATAGLREQLAISMDPAYQWWLDVLLNGELQPGAGWPEFVPFYTLHRAFMVFQDRQARSSRRPLTQQQLRDILLTLLPSGTPVVRRTSLIDAAPIGAPPCLVQASRSGVVLPPLSACRQRFEDVTGVRFGWDEVEATQPAFSHGGTDDDL